MMGTKSKVGPFNFLFISATSIVFILGAPKGNLGANEKI